MFNNCTYFEIGSFFIVSVIDVFDLKMSSGHFELLCSRVFAMERCTISISLRENINGRTLNWKVQKTTGVNNAYDLYKKPRPRNQERAEAAFSKHSNNCQNTACDDYLSFTSAK